MITATAPETTGGGLRDRQGAADATLLDAVTDLRRDVARTAFPLPLPTVEVAEARRTQLLDQLDDHLLPRLRELSAPALVVVAGSTGAGKSTLVNSVLGTEVSAAGVLRPTTRRPVLVHHPEDATLLSEHPLLDVVDVVAHESVPRGLALVDAPDLDSLLASNRATAHRLLEAADLWLFVTTAARYGDALPWEVLDRAHERGTSMAMVLNRVPDDALVAVRGDLMARLRDRGMAAVPLFLVPDLGPHEGMLEPRRVAPIQRWLAMVAGPDRARSVIARTQRGSLRALRPWVDELAEAVQAQVDARVTLETVVRDAAERPAAGVVAAIRSGAVARGPVRARWAAHSGTGPLGSGMSRRGRAARADALDEVAQEIVTSVDVVVDGARRRAATAVAEALAGSGLPGAEGLLALPDETSRDETSRDETSAVPAGQAGTASLPAPAEAEGSVAQQWLDTIGTDLEGAATGDRGTARRLDRLRTSAGPRGPVTLVAAAASGLGAARALLVTALGADVAESLVARAVDDLCARVEGHARTGTQAALAHLAHPALADDAASLLRLRLAVLKGLR